MIHLKYVKFKKHLIKKEEQKFFKKLILKPKININKIFNYIFKHN